MKIKSLDALVMALPLVAVSCAPASVQNVPREPVPVVSQAQQINQQQNINYSRELADLIDTNAARLPTSRPMEKVYADYARYIDTPYGRLSIVREIFPDTPLNPPLRLSNPYELNPYGYVLDKVRLDPPGRNGRIWIDIRRQEGNPENVNYLNIVFVEKGIIWLMEDSDFDFKLDRGQKFYEWPAHGFGQPSVPVKSMKPEEAREHQDKLGRSVTETFGAVNHVLSR